MPTEPTSSTAQQAMETLTAQWYNAIVTGCRLNAETFQLSQGFPVLGATSTELWAVFDALPPQSLTQYWNPAQLSSFSSIYGGVLSALSGPSEAPLQNAMGDWYAKWLTYKERTSLREWPEGGVLQLFNEWQLVHMPTGQGQRAYTVMASLMANPVNAADDIWARAGGSGATTKAYEVTAAKLALQLEQAPGPIHVTMNSSTASSNLSHAWARGKVGGLFDFFSGSAHANWDSVTTKLTRAGITIDLTLTRLLTLSYAPLSHPNPNDPDLQEYKPWYSSAVLADAYKEPSPALWGQAPPTWEATFGPGGTLAAIKTGLVLASGITAKITSAATFEAGERQAIEASAKLGFFPFFSAQASGGWQHAVSFNEEGAMTVTSTVPANVTTVLGAIVTPAASIFGGG